MLSLGAVYRWAWLPLVTGAVVLGVAALSSARRLRAPDGPLAAAVTMLAAAVLVQLIPLPAPLLESLSPAAGRFLSQHDLA